MNPPEICEEKSEPEAKKEEFDVRQSAGGKEEEKNLKMEEKMLRRRLVRARIKRPFLQVKKRRDLSLLRKSQNQKDLAEAYEGGPL